MITIFETKLSIEEENKSLHIALLRNKKNGQVPNKRSSQRHSDLAIHHAGVKGEIVVSKLIGGSVDQRFLIGGDDGAPDLVTKSGLRVEVKAAMYDPPIIKLNNIDEFKSDVIVSCFTKGPLVKVYGYINKDRFMERYTTRNFGYGKRFILYPADLLPIQDLISDS
jgi:hypothetical protein